MSGYTPTPAEIVVVGAGVVAHRFVESLLSRAEVPLHVTVIGDEGRRPYDRGRLSRLFSGATPEELELDRTAFDDFRVRLLADDRALRIDRGAQTVTTRSRTVVPYDTLVLATGSYAGEVAAEGADLPGCFAYRTVDDVERLLEFVGHRERMLGRPLRGVVIGGGTRGLDAAGALQDLGVEATLVRCSDRLMPAQGDALGEAALLHLLAARGILVRAETLTTRLHADASGMVAAVESHDGSVERADVVVFTVGARPRDELARNAALDVASTGGVIIDDRCATSDPCILAIGEVAHFDGRCVALVAPGHAMAEVAATRVLGARASPRGDDHPAVHESSEMDVSGGVVLMPERRGDAVDPRRPRRLLPMSAAAESAV